MNNIKFSIFDFFAYLIPGAIILLAFASIFNPSLMSIADVGQQFQGIDISTGLVAIIVSYVIGFAADSIGSWLYVNIAYKFLGSPKLGFEGELTFSEQRALVRQFSPENFQFIHNWKVLKTMSHNLSCAFLMLMVAILIEMLQSTGSQKMQWLLLALITLLMSILCMHRAHVFDTWHYKNLATTVKALHLEQRALKDVEHDLKL
ncbi:MAG: hypothetical protein F6K00_12955 [Leptolyngbya sp. SIOISBB]|nr:hypothetical protein [Leptolyngbya sp. SIOISBB]